MINLNRKFVHQTIIQRLVKIQLVQLTLLNVLYQLCVTKFKKTERNNLHKIFLYKTKLIHNIK